MKAIVQEGYGSPDVLHLREIEPPALPDDDGILIKVRAASVNAADCHLLRMPLLARVILGLRRPKMAVRGFDVSGVVEAVGGRETRFKPGDEVFGRAPGSFAEYAIAREDGLASKPARLTFGQAAALPIAGVTALQGLRDQARVQRGQRVLIHGAGGGVGTFAVQIAKALGAHVTAVTSTRNMEIVRSLGPDEVIDYTRQDVARSGQRYDVFFDVAATRSLRDCRSVLAPDGTFVAAGAAKGGSLAVMARLIALLATSRFVSQRLVVVMARVRDHDLVALKELVDSGQVTPVIDREYSLSEVPDAMRYVASGQARAKVVINIS